MAVASSSHVFTVIPSSPEGGLLTLFQQGVSCGVPPIEDNSPNFSNVSSSHGLRFTNFSSMVPFHWVQSVRNSLLQCGSLPLLQCEFPAGSQALPANLLQWWALPFMGLQFLPMWASGPAPVWASNGVTASFRHPPAFAWGPPWAAGGSLLHCGPPRASGAQLSHHGLHPGLQGNLCSDA